MAAQTIDGKRLFIRQIPKESTTPSRLINKSSSKITANTMRHPSPSQPPLPSSSTSSAVQSTKTLITHTEITPTTRIVVVRTTSGKEDEKSEKSERDDSARSKSVELPPVFTNGRTSVYLIRRPIPPPELIKPTQLFETMDDSKQTTTTTTTDNLQDVRTDSRTGEIKTSSDSPSQINSSSRRRKALKRRSRFARSDSPTVYSPDDNHSGSPNHLLSSPTQSGISQPTTRRSRSRSRSRRRRLAGSNSKDRSTTQHRSRSATRRMSPNHYSLTSPSSTQGESKDPGQKRGFFSFARTKNMAIQADLPLSGTIGHEPRRVRNVQSRVARSTQRKKSANPRVKSAKSIVLVNPKDHTIAVIENSYVNGATVKPVIKRLKSSKKSGLQQDINNRSTEKLVNTSRRYRCLGCLSRHMCLIIIICFILVLIGLAGVGVSAYFYATNSGNSVIPEIIGIAVGGALTIAALIFLCCILACIGSRDGYFSYNNDDSGVGGRAFALIPSSHPNAHRYIPGDMTEIHEINKTPSLPLISTISTTQQQTTHRQKTVVNETNVTTSAKNVTIEMPERLLTGRKMSPKSHELKLKKVVDNIGHVVEDAKKRYHGDVPNKVIVKVDETAKPTA